MKNKEVGAAESRMHYGFVIVACCCLMMGVCVGLTFSCAGIFYKPVSESLGVPVGEFGIYMSVMYITSTLMLSVAGNMIEKYSARKLFAGNAAVMGLTFLAMSTFSSVWGFYVAGGVLGITLAFLLYLSFPTLVNRWFHTRVGLMIGICSAASGVGGMIFNPMAGWIISTWGWRWGYAVFGIIILVFVTPLLFLFLSDHPADKGLLPYGAKPESSTAKSKVAAAEGRTFKEAARSPLFYALILFAFLMMGISTLNLFIPGYVTDHSFTLEEAAVVAAVVMAGVTVGKIVLGWINDRSSLYGVLVTTLFGALGLWVLLMGAGNYLMILCGAFLFGWEYAGVTVQTAMLTRTVFGSRDYARIYSIISIALAAGGALASGGWGLLADATSTPVIFEVGVGGLIVCMLIGVWSLMGRRKAHHS
ncbi:MAG: MFS transporter [Bacteroidales bacterium]|nr:MFS transporter [Bacteroidales bacterium]